MTMALVDYSDSEGSEDEKPQTKPVTKVTQPNTNTNFAVDRSNPRKIRVNLSDIKTPATNGEDSEEPAAKRPRIGGGGLSGFNAMLPAPKRDAENSAKAAAAKSSNRKVFSLKTGAEPGFSRESDAELRNLFAEQDITSGTAPQAREDLDVGLPEVPKAVRSSDKLAELPTRGSPFMFKPLSVARNTKKKKAVNGNTNSNTAASTSTSATDPSRSVDGLPSATTIHPPLKKISLFSTGQTEPAEPIRHPPEEDDQEFDEEMFEVDQVGEAAYGATNGVEEGMNAEPQSLNSIASDLNLSAADRRQLFGRGGKSGTAINIVNFNTDQEYAHNEELRAAGETVQHNPVRAIAPGKHSLKQLVSAASGQKEALEESFASGRRNKREAGNKYGW